TMIGPGSTSAAISATRPAIAAGPRTEPGMTDFTLAGSLDLFKAFDGFKGTRSYYLGLHGGYNYMFPSRFLIGIEADASFPNNIHGVQKISSDLTGAARSESGHPPS